MKVVECMEDEGLPCKEKPLGKGSLAKKAKQDLSESSVSIMIIRDI
jgi:hypothetical protein